MAKKMINSTHIEGLLYDHKLEVKETGPNSKHPGTTYITGDVMIVTDNAMTNVVSVHYRYVTQMTNKNKPDSRFTALSDIMSGKRKTVISDGADYASMIRIDSSVGLNEFFAERDGKEELVSAKRNEGGFIHFDGSGDNQTLLTDEAKRSYFKTDMVITNVIEKEANESRNLPAKAIVKGWIFDFRNAIYPVEYSVVTPEGMGYFLGLGATSKTPFCTAVWGVQVSENLTRKIVTESAFGADDVHEVTTTRKDFVITGSSNEPYEWDSEEFITAAEFNKAMTDRETYLATIKHRRDEWAAAQKAANKSAVPAPSHDDFKF